MDQIEMTLSRIVNLVNPVRSVVRSGYLQGLQTGWWGQGLHIP